jgi:hypothetical protein
MNYRVLYVKEVGELISLLTRDPYLMIYANLVGRLNGNTGAPTNNLHLELARTSYLFFCICSRVTI